MQMKNFRLRFAHVDDIDQLVALEQQAFMLDRISRRSWRHLEQSRSAILLVADMESAVAGCAVILLRRHSSVARLYSLAVDTNARQAGIGRALTIEASLVAAQRGCAEIRLESRIDNPRAHTLFRSLGFTPFGALLNNYYADGTSAIRFRHKLRGYEGLRAAP